MKYGELIRAEKGYVHTFDFETEKERSKAMGLINNYAYKYHAVVKCNEFNAFNMKTGEPWFFLSVRVIKQGDSKKKRISPGMKLTR